MFVYFLNCKVKGSYNLMFIQTWRVLSIQSDPYQALRIKTTKTETLQKGKVKNCKLVSKSQILNSQIPDYNHKVQSFLLSAPYDH